MPCSLFVIYISVTSFILKVNMLLMAGFVFKNGCNLNERGKNVQEE